ncbi:hypothetical protein QVD99_003666 [Batrachochytrium dendrobatidis]|nr:hypothetical protein QVD99_003666 [Batrachochytrium dendrobatidis]
MEVVQSNFEEVLDSVREAIENADFIAVDTEFTGLGLTPNERLSLLDTPQERYLKHRSAARLFEPIQIGLAAFKWDAEQGVYMSKPFNFNIYPRTGNKFFGLDRTFCVQISSLEFLEGNGFDFNKWIREGIPFVSITEEAAIRKKLETINTESDIVIDEKNTEYVKDFIESVQKWLCETTDESYSISTSNSFHKRLIHQEIKKQFPGQVSTESTKSGVNLKRLQANQKDSSHAESRQALLKAELDLLVGFRKVIDIMVAAQKPIVGHNMSLDLFHIIHRFIQPLPDTWEEYKDIVNRNFPSVFDTKFMAISNKNLQTAIINTTLGNLYDSILKEPFDAPSIKLAMGFDSYANDVRELHKAGFDAYISGVSFLKMLGLVDSLPASTSINWTSDFSLHCKNKLYIMYSDIPFLNLSGIEEIPDRSNVFYLSEFLPTWKTRDILNKFKEFGGITVKWINDTSCLIIVRDRKMVTVAERFCTSQDTDYKLRIWDGSHTQTPGSPKASASSPFLAAANPDTDVSTSDKLSTLISKKEVMAEPKSEIQSSVKRRREEYTGTASEPVHRMRKHKRVSKNGVQNDKCQMM